MNEARLTVVLLHWKRPDNILKIIANWRLQTVPVKIFLWDNGHLKDPPAVDLYVRASENMMCYPRWYLASLASTEFVCTNDDDIMPVRRTLARDIIADLERRPDGAIIGPIGLNLDNGRYHTDDEIRAAGTSVDVIKGRMMCMRTKFFDRVPMRPPLFRGTEEDIFVCGYATELYVPTLFSHALTGLPAPHAVSADDNHLQRRQDATDYYIMPKLRKQQDGDTE